MPALDTNDKAALLGVAQDAADTMVEIHGHERTRIGAPTYSAADLSRGGWSVIVTALDDGKPVRRARVYLNGTREDVEIPDADVPRFGVTNASTYGFCLETDDRAAADRCAAFISGTVVDRQADVDAGAGLQLRGVGMGAHDRANRVAADARAAVDRANGTV